VLLGHGSNKAFWYLIHEERQKETATAEALTWQRTPLKTIRTTLVSVIIRQFDIELSLKLDT
jgi:hypothetical protein